MLTALILTTQQPLPDHCSKPAPVAVVRQASDSPDGEPHSQWIWRQYASSVWDDIRIDNVLPFRSAKDGEDEKHVHPLQLDVIDRAVVMWSNPGETVLTPFMGVGSEVYGSVRAGRRGVGIELKPSYYKQATLNLEKAVAEDAPSDQPSLL